MAQLLIGGTGTKFFVVLDARHYLEEALSFTSSASGRGSSGASSPALRLLHSKRLQVCKQFLFFSGNVDVSVFETIHFHVYVALFRESLLKSPEQWTHFMYFGKWDLIDQLFRCRIAVFKNSLLLVSRVVKYWVDLGSLQLRKVLKRYLVSSRLNQQLIADTELLLDLLRLVESQQLSPCHNANSVGKLIGFFQMLRCHDDGSTNLERLDQVPDLSP